MSNFDENNEFVRRPADSASQNRSIPNRVARPRDPGTGEQAPRTGAERPVRHTEASGGAPRAGGTPRRPESERQERIYPDGEHRRTSPSHNTRSVGSGDTRKNAPAEDKKAPEKKKGGGFGIGDAVKNVLIFLAMLGAMLALGFVLILSSLYVAPEKRSQSYVFYRDDKPQYESVTVNGVLYMNLSELSEMCGFTVSGSKACLRFTAFAEEYVEFTIGSRSAKINGDIINMEGAALVRENENVWIPLSFADTYISGVSFVRNEEECEISIEKEKAGEENDGTPIYSEVTFRIKGSQTLPNVAEDPDIGEDIDLEFVNDLSEYEQYMNPEDRDAYLILVNKTNSIDESSIPENLVSIADVRKDGRKEQMVETAEKALEAMFIELRSAGYTDVSVTSGYRSYQKQVSLFSTYLNREKTNNPSLSEEEAKQIVLTYSAFPGTSEHQTGLACDMHNLSSASVAFAQKEAYAWLKENCHKFGFILRFPEDKVEITGYSFEPWHYRFVGRYHATRMNSLGMCLEEYVAHMAKAEQ